MLRILKILYKSLRLYKTLFFCVSFLLFHFTLLFFFLSFFTFRITFEHINLLGLIFKWYIPISQSIHVAPSLTCLSHFKCKYSSKTWFTIFSSLIVHVIPISHLCFSFGLFYFVNGFPHVGIADFEDQILTLILSSVKSRDVSRGWRTCTRKSALKNRND